MCFLLQIDWPCKVAIMSCPVIKNPTEMNHLIAFVPKN